MNTTPTERFRAARDFLVAHREDYATAYAEFRWPELPRFNWALDHFDPYAHGNARTALWIVNEVARKSAAASTSCARPRTGSPTSCVRRVCGVAIAFW